MRNIIKPERRCTHILGRLARLPKSEVRRLASIAAMASVASEKAHRWTPETARIASQKAAQKRREAAKTPEQATR